jgi:hypothetical protein
LAGKFKKIDFGGISILKMAGKFNILKLFSEDQNGTEHSQKRTQHYSVDIFFPQSVWVFFSLQGKTGENIIIESREVLVYRIA